MYNPITRAMNARTLKQKREAFERRRQQMIARETRAIEEHAAKAGVSVDDFKRGMVAAHEQMSAAPARARAERYARIEAEDTAAHARVDAMQAEAAAFTVQQRAERDAAQIAPGHRVLFIDDGLEQRVAALQQRGEGVEAAQLINKAVKDGVAALVPE
jgi:hypothetical protein